MIIFGYRGGKRKDQREMAARLMELTARYRAGELSEPDYQAQLRALTGAGGMGQTAMPGAHAAELPPPPTQ